MSRQINKITLISLIMRMQWRQRARTENTAVPLQSLSHCGKYSLVGSVTTKLILR